MSKDIRELIKEHRAFYEVRPYYVVVQCRLEDGSRGSRTVQAGFDIDLYGVVGPGDWQPPEDYWIACSEARDVIAQLNADSSNTCRIDVIPFGSSVFINPRNQSRRYTLLRVRIANRAGIDELAELSKTSAVTDLTEKQMLKQLEARLQQLGISSGASAA